MCRALAIFLLLTLPRPDLRAAAPPPNCLRRFAAAGGALSAERIAVTYWDLVDQVSRGKVSIETLRKMADSEDPFAVPEQADYDLGVLRKQMKQFEGMVREKGGHTPAVLAALKESLRRRVKGLDDAVGAENRATEATVADFKIDINHDNGTTESPDGRYLVSTNRGGTWPADSPWTLNVYDLKERRRTEVPGSNLNVDPPHFTPDGKYLVFRAKQYQLLLLPFQDGQVDWNRKRTIGTPHEKSKGQPILFGKNPNRIISGANLNFLLLYDVQKGTSVPLRVKEQFVGDERDIGNDAFGIIPGTDSFFLRTQYESRERLRRFKVSDDGGLALEETLWDKPLRPFDHPETFHEQFFFLPDGRPVLVLGLNNDPSFNFYVGKDQQKLRFEFRPGHFTPAKTQPRNQIVIHPTKNEGLITINDSGTVNQRWVHHYDFDRGVMTGPFPLTDRALSIYYSGDGERLYGAPWRKPLQSLNYRMKLEPK